jgi:hypothetical protein
MTSESNDKRKSERGKKPEPKFVITEWAVEEAATPHHVSVSFVTHQESINGVSRNTTRRFRLRREQAAALIDELRGVLDESAAFPCDEQSTATVLPFSSTRLTDRNNEQDFESLSNPFALGAGYGLLGN